MTEKTVIPYDESLPVPVDLPYDANYEPTREGIFNIPFVEYCQIKALNSSVLKEADISMAHLKTARDEPYKAPTPDMIKGQAFHLLTLEPERWNEDMAMDPGYNKNSNKYKDWLAEQKNGVMVISKKNLAAARQMVMAMRRKVMPRELLKSGWTEQTVLWKDPIYGFWCKARLDFITVNGAVVDLKKSESAREWGFRRSIDRYKYNWQASWYLKGINIATGINHGPFYWIVWEADPPYEGRVFEANPIDLDEAAREIDEVLELYNVALETDDYPGFPDTIAFFGERDIYTEYEDVDDSGIDF
jgi:hypothetical protein